MSVVKASFELSIQTSFQIFSFPTAWYTWLYNNIPGSQCQICVAPTVFYFSDNLDNRKVYATLRVSVLYSHYNDSSSSKKLDGHQA